MLGSPPMPGEGGCPPGNKNRKNFPITIHVRRILYISYCSAIPGPRHPNQGPPLTVKELIEKLSLLPAQMQDRPAVFMSRVWMDGETTAAQFMGYGHEEKCLVEVEDVLTVVERYADEHNEVQDPVQVIQLWA